MISKLFHLTESSSPKTQGMMLFCRSFTVSSQNWVRTLLTWISCWAQVWGGSFSEWKNTSAASKRGVEDSRYFIILFSNNHTSFCEHAELINRYADSTTPPQPSELLPAQHQTNLNPVGPAAVTSELSASCCVFPSRPTEEETPNTTVRLNLVLWTQNRKSQQAHRKAIVVSRLEKDRRGEEGSVIWGEERNKTCVLLACTY